MVEEMSSSFSKRRVNNPNISISQCDPAAIKNTSDCDVIAIMWCSHYLMPVAAAY
jgi:hypothetical protein